MNRDNHIRETSLIQRRYEDKYFKLVAAVLQSEVDNVAGIVSHEGLDAALRYAMVHIHSKELPGIVTKLYNEVGLRFARRQWILFMSQHRAARKSAYYRHELKGFGFNAEWVKFIHDYLYLHLIEKITFKVAETTRDILLTVLNEAIAGGWGIDKTVRALDDLPLSRTQAARIVRTEITRAANTGVFAAGSTFEFEQSKEWISAHDMRTRGQKPGDHASHIALDGITINYDDKFTDPINGDKLLYPGDPSASAASTINCRCNIALVAKVDPVTGRLIPRRQSTVVVMPGDFVRHNPIITI